MEASSVVAQILYDSQRLLPSESGHSAKLIELLLPAYSVEKLCFSGNKKTPQLVWGLVKMSTCV